MIEPHIGVQVSYRDNLASKMCSSWWDNCFRLYRFQPGVRAFTAIFLCPLELQFCISSQILDINKSVDFQLSNFVHLFIWSPKQFLRPFYCWHLVLYLNTSETPRILPVKCLSPQKDLPHLHHLILYFWKHILIG